MVNFGKGGGVWRVGKTLKILSSISSNIVTSLRMGEIMKMSACDLSQPHKQKHEDFTTDSVSNTNTTRGETFLHQSLCLRGSQ